MSENKTTQPEAQSKTAEDIAKNKKVVESAKGATEAAKEKYFEAQSTLKEVTPGDAKSLGAAKKAFEEAKADYLKKREEELQARTKAAQNGTYVPRDPEKGLFHVKLDKPSFNSKTGAKISKEFIQKFTSAEWNTVQKNSTGLGYTMTIMWNPELFNL